MGCHKRPEVRAFLNTVDPILGIEFGEGEWHALRRIVEGVEGRRLPRAKTTPVEALVTAQRLSRSLRLLPVQEAALFAAVEQVPVFSRGTLDCFDYMAVNGMVSSWNEARRLSGLSLVRDFLGRLLTLDGMWLVEQAQGEHPGESGGWRVLRMRPVPTEQAVFPSFSQARRYVAEQSPEPYPGARRREYETGALTTACAAGHVHNFDTEDVDVCVTCGVDLSGFPVVPYRAVAAWSVDDVDAMFAGDLDDEGDSEG